MPVASCTQTLCDLALKFGEDGDDDDDDSLRMSRPFGVALLLGGWDDNGPVLFHADPSGTFVRYDAVAIGSGSEGAQTNLQETYRWDQESST